MFITTSAVIISTVLTHFVVSQSILYSSFNDQSSFLEHNSSGEQIGTLCMTTSAIRDDLEKIDLIMSLLSETEKFPKDTIKATKKKMNLQREDLISKLKFSDRCSTISK